MSCGVTHADRHFSMIWWWCPRPRTDRRHQPWASNLFRLGVLSLSLKWSPTDLLAQPFILARLSARSPSGPICWTRNARWATLLRCCLSQGSRTFYHLLAHVEMAAPKYSVFQKARTFLFVFKIQFFASLSHNISHTFDNLSLLITVVTR